MTTARLSYNGNDIDFDYGVQKYNTTNVQDMSQQRAASGVMEQININGSQEVSVSLFFDADTKAELDSWWWTWAREGGEFSFALDKSKAGYTTIDYAPGIELDYLFHNTDNGFVATNCTLDTYLKFMRVTPTAINPNWQIGSLSYTGSVNTVIRAKIRRDSGSDWAGRFYYKTSSHAFSGLYYADISEPSGVDDDWVIVEWRGDNLTAGGTDYTDNTIIGFRFDLSEDDSTVYDVEWVRIGSWDTRNIVYVANTTLFAVDDEVMIIGDGDDDRSVGTISSISDGSNFNLEGGQNLFLPDFTPGDVVRHVDYYPTLMTLDKNYSPRALSGGQFYTADFSWIEVL